MYGSIVDNRRKRFLVQRLLMNVMIGVVVVVGSKYL
jgi:hypothetical protein